MENIKLSRNLLVASLILLFVRQSISLMNENFFLTDALSFLTAIFYFLFVGTIPKALGVVIRKTGRKEMLVSFMIFLTLSLVFLLANVVTFGYLSLPNILYSFLYVISITFMISLVRLSIT